MPPTIGKTYQENKLQLEQRLSELPAISALADRHWCYFCVTQMNDGQMKILVDETPEKRDLYFVHEECYAIVQSETGVH